MSVGIYDSLLLVVLLGPLQAGEAQKTATSAAGAPVQAASGKQETDAAERSTVATQQDPPPRDGLLVLGRMLDQNWQQRPEWADMAAGILKGRAMGTGNGWFHPARKRHDWAWLRERLDTNDDGRVEVAEFSPAVPQANAWFKRLDGDRSGDLTEADFDWSGHLARSSDDPASTTTDLLFDRADTDSNGRVTRDEILEFFAQVDRDGAGFWTPEDLYAALVEPKAPAPAASQSRAAYVEKMLDLLFSGQLGWFEPGPDLGDTAPDFALATHDGASSVTLSDSFGNKPVVLVFGSFT